MMWICPACNQKFLHQNQNHSCGDKTIADFLNGKTAHTLALFYYFLDEYKRIGNFELHPAKSRIALARHTRFCSINQLGKDFLHFVLPLDKLYPDNLVFTKIGQLPNSKIFNHHCRIYSKDDVNDEVKKFMRLAYDIDAKKQKKF